MTYQHVPVMLKEVLEHLQVKPGKKYIDCTLGGAGYTTAIAEKKGKVLAIDLDDLALNNARKIIEDRKLKNVILVKDNFKNLREIVVGEFPAGTKFSGIVLDLGLSSAQLDDIERGFSFKGSRPLDMTFGPSDNSTEEIVNSYPLLELTRIFREYGEERRAYPIAKAIVQGRKKKRIKTTTDLVQIVEECVPKRFHQRIHPATKIFQALRMETNTELDSLSQVLPSASDLLEKGGRLVVVSFHSGEDRIVKRYFKSDEGLEILTKRPLIAGEEEVRVNSRSRSAKLRAAQKV